MALETDPLDPLSALRETDENWATYGPHESTVGAAAARP